MKIEPLKRAAEFLGETIHDINQYRVEVKHYVTFADGAISENGSDLFNPHEEEGAHWLKKMELKLSPEQWKEYRSKMIDAFPTDTDSEWKSMPFSCLFERWLKCEAPTSLCFEKIMEVI